MRYVVLEKNVGETPLQRVDRWKEQHTTYAGVTSSYAGRLDPMASGKLLVLLGDECKKQKNYTGLDKEYEIEVLLDIGSDTGDALGIISYTDKNTRVEMKKLSAIVGAQLGMHTRAYPHFSSKTVNGKPLFLHTLEGALDSITIPTHQECIYRIQVIGASEIASIALQTRIHEYLALVPRTTKPSKMLGADFRISEVTKSWNEVFSQNPKRTFQIVKMRVTCGSGTYMRTLAPRIAEQVGTKGIALSIHRTRMGRFRFGFWIQSYN